MKHSAFDKTTLPENEKTSLAIKSNLFIFKNVLDPEPMPAHFDQNTLETEPDPMTPKAPHRPVEIADINSPANAKKAGGKVVPEATTLR